MTVTLCNLDWVAEVVRVCMRMGFSTLSFQSTACSEVMVDPEEDRLLHTCV